MRQQEIFGNAKWLSGCGDEQFSVLRGKFHIEKVQKATLYVLGLGLFHCYINGKRVGDERYLPLNSEYERRKEYPVNETLAGHRVYVPRYDITSLLRDGENTITIHFGGGWYTYEDEFTKKFGDAKAIWRIIGETEEGKIDFVSSDKDMVRKSFVTDYNFLYLETHNYMEGNSNMFQAEYDDSHWKHAKEAVPLNTSYEFSDCPADSVCETLSSIEIGRTPEAIIYDCGKNISGYPILEVKAQKGEQIEVLFSEELNDDGTLDMKHSYGQKLVIDSDGENRIEYPLFTWYGFRYFSVKGNAAPLEVHVVHSKVRNISSFKTDNDTLNWIHDAYLNTQLCNMHMGIPSDCPHIERRGYTGDGQLACHAAMTMLDAKKFYRKWMYDIADCQDIHSGHIQYVSPYIRNGGGPGGWGCAIVEVPYQYYRHYEDLSVLDEMYPVMLRYFDYLEAHSSGGVVISDKEGEWCLGDWCTPKSVILPAPYVNNYFYIKSLKRVIEISRLLNKTDMIPEFERRIAERKQAIMSYYFNKWDGNFLGNQQGANAFAIDIGLGDERTYDNLVSYYQQIGHYDTGIFGTDILTRILFECGDGQLALDLLTSEHQHSYHEMKRLGATTIWEYWPGSLRNRSHNHPMFGAIVAYFYEYLVGIKTIGYYSHEKIEIEPVLFKGIHELKGEREFSDGKVSVEYLLTETEAKFIIQIPETRKGVLRIENAEYPLSGGENRINVPIQIEREQKHDCSFIERCIEERNLPDLMQHDREEWIEILSEHVYGKMPEKIGETTWKEIEEIPNAAGKAVTRTVEITFPTPDGESFSFPTYVTMPHTANAHSPKAAFVFISFGKIKPHYYPMEELMEQDVIVAEFVMDDIAPDRDDGFKELMASHYYKDGERPPNGFGKIGMWAFAASRVLDYLLTLNCVDKEHVGVIGHSRLGKTALWAGANDTRFTHVFSNDSGCAGAALTRNKVGEDFTVICGVFPYWFCESMKKLSTSVEASWQSDFDQHFLLAAVAPRKVYVASAKEDEWADPISEYLSCVAATPAWEAYGLKGFVHPDRFPECGEALMKGNVGYHIREGEHFLSRHDWQQFCNFIKQD